MEKRLLCMLVLAALPAIAPDLTGTWQGMLVSPRGEFRTVIKASKGNGAALNVLLYSIDQSAVENPGSMTVQGPNVKVSIPGLSGTFDGNLSPDGSSIADTWTRGSVAMPLSLKHVNEDAAWPIPKLRFDVASIKPSVPGIKLVSELQPLPGGRISAWNMSLKNLIGVAYRLKPFQITGGPSWLGSISYDIEAKPDNPAKAGAWQTMLPTLLADRFRLQFHRETKELPVYALVPAHKDGKPGPGLKLAKEGSCVDRHSPSANESRGPLCVVGAGAGGFQVSGCRSGEWGCAFQSVGRPGDRQNGLNRKIRFRGTIRAHRRPSAGFSKPFTFRRPSRAARTDARTAKRAGGNFRYRRRSEAHGKLKRFAGPRHPRGWRICSRALRLGRTVLAS